MTRANFFVVGAAKAGTTSLASFLESLPDVFISPIKEPCHFCTDTNQQLHNEMKRQQVLDTDKYFAQGMPFPMHIAHVPDPAHYDMLFSQANDAIAIGECTTYYLPSKVAAEGIHAYNPDAKIIIVLRDPLARIQSHYKMDLRMGFETRPLETCLNEEIALGDTADFTNCRMYLAMSDYKEQVARYHRVFGTKQVCVIKFEDLKENPASVLPQVLTFLNVPTDTVSMELPRENAGDVEPRFELINRWLYKSGAKRFIRHALRSVLPRRAISVVKNLYYGKSKGQASSPASNVSTRPEITVLGEKYKNMFKP